MELYEIKNGLEDARLLLDQLYVSANIEVLKREIELFLKAYKCKRYQLGDRIITLIEKLNFLKK